ncbi:MAG: GDP-mannose 4,6-dehydratase, partial [Niameybacter sp.]
MKQILVTGGAGFIGSNFIQYMLAKYAYKIINLDLLTYAGNLENLAEVENHPQYTFIKGDIRDREILEKVFEAYQIDTVIN